MNNITFGDEGSGYYETVAGGAGAVSMGDVMMMERFLVLTILQQCEFELQILFTLY